MDLSKKKELFYKWKCVIVLARVIDKRYIVFKFVGAYLVILFLIQLGGIGYMTFSSFVILSTKKYLDDRTKNIAQTVFSIPKNFRIEKFILSVITFSAIVEILGAIGLFFVFLQAGIKNPLWSAIFHSVSAFCTAGYNLLV